MSDPYWDQTKPAHTFIPDANTVTQPPPTAPSTSYGGGVGTYPQFKHLTRKVTSADMYAIGGLAVNLGTVDNGEFWYLRSVTFNGFIVSKPPATNDINYDMYIATAPLTTVATAGIGNTRIKSHPDTVIASNRQTAVQGANPIDFYVKENQRLILLPQTEINLFIDSGEAALDNLGNQFGITVDIYVTDTLASVP